MAIQFPSVLPIKWFEWALRVTKAATAGKQAVDIRDQGHFQFVDTTTALSRVVVINSDFESVGEVTGSDMDIQTINALNVYTFIVDYDDYVTEGDVMYLGIADANVNRFMQNYIPNGTFTTTDYWTLAGASLSITGGTLTFSIAGAGHAEATHELQVQVGREYTVTVVTTGQSNLPDAGVYNGSTQVLNLTEIGIGTATATFTATDTSISIEFDASGTSLWVIDSITLKATGTSIVPDYISSPFCLGDIENTTTLLYACSVNDYFGLYFVDTSLQPRIRVYSDLNDDNTIQETESLITPNGEQVTYYVQQQSTVRLNIDWLPSYMVTFIKSIPYMDQFHIDEDVYYPVEEVQVTQNNNAPHIMGFSMRLTKKQGGITFKRIVNDPNDASCEISSEGYFNVQFGEYYYNASLGEFYYPSN